MSRPRRKKAPALPSESEESLLRKVIQLGRLCGWRVAHFRPARTRTGWRTAVSGDGKGWPDLVLLRRGVIVVAELKSEAGQLTAEQHEWLADWKEAGARTFVWRPSSWAEIQEVLH